MHRVTVSIIYIEKIVSWRSKSGWKKRWGHMKFSKTEDVYGTVLPIFQLLGPVRSLWRVQTRSGQLKTFCKIHSTLLGVRLSSKIWNIIHFYSLKYANPCFRLFFGLQIKDITYPSLQHGAAALIHTEEAVIKWGFQPSRKVSIFIQLYVRKIQKTVFLAVFSASNLGQPVGSTRPRRSGSYAQSGS